MNNNYQTFMLSDEPRLFGISIIVAAPLFGLSAFGVLSGHLYQLLILGFIISGAMYFKFGANGIRSFIALCYWFLPRQLTAGFLRRAPDSSTRVYLR